VDLKLADQATYDELARVSLELFRAGTDLLAQKGLCWWTPRTSSRRGRRLTLIEEKSTPPTPRASGAPRTTPGTPLPASAGQGYVRRGCSTTPGTATDAAQAAEEAGAEATRRYCRLRARHRRAAGPGAGQDPREACANLVRRDSARTASRRYPGSTSDQAHCASSGRPWRGTRSAVDLRSSPPATARDRPHGAGVQRLGRAGAASPSPALQRLGGAWRPPALPVSNSPPQDQTDLLLNVTPRG
jgi:hypothetical protein